MLAQEEDLANGYAMDMTKKMEKGHSAIAKKHIAIASGFAKKIAAKRNQVLKSKSMAASADSAVLAKAGNKYEESLAGVQSLLDEWRSEGNKALLEKLLSI